ncbi:aldehyde dehydrogenase family protein [Paenalcaligenes niemegkensis]|uniref:aldehyde dehydrogenase family protein n=1 Tax=Paenalcaligenes niemegkensis TaxID=2895469 RepID=UPI001EE7919A|nr:aldehyde dehydrogenase family protein [Paenalcaligenes niemegkensis]MCQ9617748.1 aldehyde dehydrogenase family protein [Paenalcaligenes niemegkensis]
MENLRDSVFKNYIDGQWVSSVSGRTSQNINPADNADSVGSFQESTADDARAAVEAAQRAFHQWRATPISKRAQVLEAAADYLEANADVIAEGLTREEGKGRGQSKGEVLRSAQTLRFYAVEGQTYTGETFPQDDPDMLVYTHREPLGVVTVIAPWNFPISIPARKIAPALIMGNTVVFKPSSDTPLTGYYLAKAFAEAGVPAGVLNFITGRASAVGPVLTESPEVRAISFTGSTAAGEKIAKAARMSTRTQMELGGKNPLIVMEDADIDLAVKLVVQGGFALSGQACTGTSRVLVHQAIKKDFTAKLIEKVKTLTVGNGLNGNFDLGPIATESQMQSILDYVAVGKSEATHLYGGERLTDGDLAKGFYVQPAVFDDVTQEMRIAREEIFGPVIALIEIDSYEDALAKANDTEYGLAASIVTENSNYAHRFATDIEAGTVKINRTTTGNLVNAPFGGLKQSSTSTFRESGRTGLEFYTQIKTVYRGI